jgi:hypothetical protein
MEWEFPGYGRRKVRYIGVWSNELNAFLPPALARNSSNFSLYENDNM